jgi:phenylacetic acid degradation operon negative regulatory protein
VALRTSRRFEQLPPALLPIEWPGAKAAAFFDAESSRLLPAASRFVDACLEARE